VQSHKIQYEITQHLVMRKNGRMFTRQLSYQFVVYGSLPMDDSTKMRTTDSSTHKLRSSENLMLLRTAHVLCVTDRRVFISGEDQSHTYVD